MLKKGHLKYFAKLNFVNVLCQNCFSCTCNYYLFVFNTKSTIKYEIISSALNEESVF